MFIMVIISSISVYKVVSNFRLEFLSAYVKSLLSSLNLVLKFLSVLAMLILLQLNVLEDHLVGLVVSMSDY